MDQNSLEAWLVFDLLTDLNERNMFVWLTERLNLSPTQRVRVYGEELALGRAVSQVRHGEPFEIEADGHYLHRVPVHRFSLQLVSFRGPSVTMADIRPEWMHEADGFVMAWLADHEYDSWQNTEDPLVYQAAGRCSPSSLVSNGLPYPLEKRVVDISGNPGRRILRKGYVEAVASAMDLSDRFWGLTGSNRARLDGLARVRSIAQGVDRISASYFPFRSSDGPEGNLQRELRKAIFPSSLED